MKITAAATLEAHINTVEKRVVETYCKSPHVPDTPRSSPPDPPRPRRARGLDMLSVEAPGSADNSSAASSNSKTSTDTAVNTGAAATDTARLQAGARTSLCHMPLCVALERCSVTRMKPLVCLLRGDPSQEVT
ncbi:hypothetical protein EYF80_062278 [Liparis tanakae]|uniref:Uncharacterized protein n=1 Tax=Liparis tanakae TaxID=230148 RepID=A0A4Z2EFB2_9TELE|nr:hypothetical protein EYF80_062278 [Liparis tanakae]